MNVLEHQPAQCEYYRALEISPSASSQEIKKAYKRLALKYHPDKCKQCLDNTSMTSINNQFILINEAYSVLAHEESRARYDSMCYTGKISNQGLSEIQLMHELFREIMAKKEQISELSESFKGLCISIGWIMSNFETENKLFNAFEKEISLTESNIFEENVDLDEQDSWDTSSYLEFPEDDIILITEGFTESSQWILVDKEALVHYHQLSEFVESHILLIKSVITIVSPLMMACTYGTWNEQKINLLQRVTSLMTRIIQYLEFVIQKIRMNKKEFEPIIDKNVQNQILNLSNHPILSKISSGQFGQNSYPLINLAVLLGPPFAGHSLYWSILAIILLSVVTVNRNEGDLEKFRQFLSIFEEIIPLLDKIT